MAVRVQARIEGDELPAWLSRQQREVLGKMLEAFENHKLSARHSLGDITDAKAVILDFLNHAHGIPGELTPLDFERWGKSLWLERGVREATQRKYQSTVRVFFEYLIRTPKFRNLARAQFGGEIEQVATPDNCIVHCQQRELTQDRRPFSEDEEQRFFDAIDDSIEIAHAQRSPHVLHFRRDKALFATQRAFGLREEEVLSIDEQSFTADPNFPEFGRYAFVRLRGKGRKWRTVPLTDVSLVPVLKWYVEDVRPGYVTKAVANESAFFISLRGGRLGYHGYYERFRLYQALAVLPRELVPHCFRHTSVSTDAQDGLSLYATQQKHGHKYAATTQVYTHIPDGFTAKEYQRVVALRMQGIQTGSTVSPDQDTPQHEN